MLQCLFLTCFLSTMLQYLITHFSDFQLACLGSFFLHESVFFLSGLPYIFLERAGWLSKYKIQVFLANLHYTDSQIVVSTDSFSSDNTKKSQNRHIMIQFSLLSYYIGAFIVFFFSTKVIADLHYKEMQEYEHSPYVHWLLILSPRFCFHFYLTELLGFPWCFFVCFFSICLCYMNCNYDD